MKKLLTASALSIMALLAGCSEQHPEVNGLLRNTYCELVDWHSTSAFGLVSCPIAWFRVGNYNPIPIKNIKVRYQTYDREAHLVSEGDYVIDESVPPGTARNFTEQYLGLVSTHSDKLAIKLVSVEAGP
jgi:hypothetical protein